MTLTDEQLRVLDLNQCGRQAAEELIDLCANHWHPDLWPIAEVLCIKWRVIHPRDRVDANR